MSTRPEQMSGLVSSEFIRRTEWNSCRSFSKCTLRSFLRHVVFETLLHGGARLLSVARVGLRFCSTPIVLRVCSVEVDVHAKQSAHEPCQLHLTCHGCV